jgi:hypothetical protein
MSVISINHIWLDERNIAWIDKTNIKVIEIALERLAHGSSVEEIAEQHHGLLSWYYDHELDLNVEIERQLETFDRLRNASLSSPGRLKLKQMGRLR